MTGHATKQRKRKTKISSGVFKKVFSFKKKQQKPHSPHASGASSPADAPIKNRTYTQTSNTVGCGSPSSDDDDDSSMCSSTVEAEGILIFPIAQRLTAFSPPPTAFLDRIPGLDQGDIKQQKGDGFLSLGRRRNISLPAIHTRAPYQSKKSQKNLSPTLKICRHKSDANYSMSHSAWERRPPTSVSRRGPTLSFSRSKGSGMTEERQAFFTETRASGFDIIQTSSSNSLFPPEVSPANKFIPIGYDENYDDCSFDSDDYDICKKSMSEDDDQPALAATIIVNMALTPGAPGKSCADEDGTPSDDMDQSAPAATIAVSTLLAPGSTSESCANEDVTPSEDMDQSAPAATTSVSTSLPTGSTNKSCGDVNTNRYSCSSDESDRNDHVSNDKYSHSSVDKQTNSCGGAVKLNDVIRRDLPPSPVSTEDTSWESNDFLIRWKGSSKQEPAPRYHIDKYCVSLEHEDEDWFPNIKQEIMKLSAIFTSNCGG